MRADVDVQAAATLVAAPLIFRLMIEQQVPDGRFAAGLADMIARAVSSPA
ncbi:hypothetical protein [Micromonospora chersina]